MPAIITHEMFAQDAFGPALETLRMFTPDERNAFLLGNQGPDPLFYLAPLRPLKEFAELGSTMHQEAPTQLFMAMRKAVDELPEENRAVARAYVAGFVCHYLLDRSVHPLVIYWQRGICGAGVEGLDESDAGVVHAEIERDLEEMVLYTKRNQTIASYKFPTEVLHGRDELLDVLGELYYRAVVGKMCDEEPTAVRVYPLAVRCYRVALYALWKPRGKGPSLVSRLEKPLLHRHYSKIRAMTPRVRAEDTSDFDNRDHLPWTNPYTGEESTDSFWDLYNHALELAAPSIKVVLAPDFDEDAARALTGGLNFSGKPVE